MKKSILNAINKMDSKEINELIGAIKRRRSVLENSAALAFLKGDKVTFDNNGRTELGVVFKVKKKAENDYFSKMDLDRLPINHPDRDKDEKDLFNYGFNWPYDFFSLVELIKIDASFEFSDVESDDNGEEKPKPKVAKEVNRGVQLDTLFPKGKK